MFREILMNQYVVMELKNDNTVAILLATYNGAPFLREQIESIQKQTYSNWILYINDDGSNDETREIISYFSKNSNQIIDISNKLPNRLGVMRNFMSMLRFVDSNYYMFSDQDDIWFQNKIELSFLTLKDEEQKLTSVSPIIVHTNVALCNSKSEIVNSNYWISCHYNPEQFKNTNFILFSNCVQGATMLINKTVKNTVTKTPDCAYKLMHDQWIAYKVLFSDGIIKTILEPTMAYRQHDNNVLGFKVQPFSLHNSFMKVRDNIKYFKVLKEIGYGSLGKSIFYKIVVLSLLNIKTK